MRYELKIDVLDKDYVDALIVCLARQGFAPYYNEDCNSIGCTMTEQGPCHIQKNNPEKNLNA